MTHLGWECPKCGSVYAPWVKRCGECPKATKPPPMPEGVTVPVCNCPKTSDGTRFHRYDCDLFPGAKL